MGIALGGTLSEKADPRRVVSVMSVGPAPRRMDAGGVPGISDETSREFAARCNPAQFADFCARGLLR
jgi:hypothetical protein